MKHILFLSLLAAALAGPPAAAPAAGPDQLSPELAKMNIAVGRWVFHGQELHARSGKPVTWTWNADCRWSPDETYLECTFNSDWSGKTVKSLVVNTYNTDDHSYWHYEMFAAGASGASPFISRMTIRGNTWVETGRGGAKGQTARERVVYHYTSDKQVSVEIQNSSDGVHWVTVYQGEGAKQP